MCWPTGSGGRQARRDEGKDLWGYHVGDAVGLLEKPNTEAMADRVVVMTSSYVTLHSASLIQVLGELRGISWGWTDGMRNDGWLGPYKPCLCGQVKLQSWLGLISLAVWTGILVGRRYGGMSTFMLRAGSRAVLLTG